MASRLSWSFRRNLYPTLQMSERVVSIEAIATYNSQGRTQYSMPILTSPSRLDLTPQILQSTELCACFVWDKLYSMGVDNDSSNWFTPQITSSVIDAASSFGNNVGFCLNVKLEFIIWDDSPVLIPINGGGGDHSAGANWYTTHDHIDEHIVMHDGAGANWYTTHDHIDGHTVMHDGDGGVIIVMDAEDLVEQQPNKGASKSVIDKLRRNKGRFDDGCADDVNGRTCCPVCLEDILPKTEVLRMPCSHLFHDHCIVRWLERNNSCPMCRKPTV